MWPDAVDCARSVLRRARASALDCGVAGRFGVLDVTDPVVPGGGVPVGDAPGRSMPGGTTPAGRCGADPIASCTWRSMACRIWDACSGFWARRRAVASRLASVTRYFRRIESRTMARPALSRVVSAPPGRTARRRSARVRTNTESAALSGPGWVWVHPAAPTAKHKSSPACRSPPRGRAGRAVDRSAARRPTSARHDGTPVAEERYLFQLTMDGMATWSMPTG